MDNRKGHIAKKKQEIKQSRMLGSLRGDQKKRRGRIRRPGRRKRGRDRTIGYGSAIEMNDDVWEEEQAWLH